MVEKSQHYTFGDTDLAAQRLRLLASVFEASSTRLLQGLADAGGEVGIDLGCGPGYTSRLLAEHVAVRRVVGLDQSPRLLEQATRERGSDRVSFAECDISSPPFPVPPASILYSRFLLTHLRDPASIVRAWASMAQPGARLVLEEMAAMSGEHPAFPRYYALVDRMQAHYGQRLFIGRELRSLSESPDWVLESGEIAALQLPAAEMARLHFLNLQSWSKDPFARANYAPRELSELSKQLEQIADGTVIAPPIAYGMSQVVLRRG